MTLGHNPQTAEVEPHYLAGFGTNKITNRDPATGAVISATQGCNCTTSRPVLFAN